LTCKLLGSMVWIDRNGANLPHASLAGSGTKYSYDDDAKRDHHTLLLLLRPSVGVYMSESKRASSKAHNPPSA
jgi:hypothetical protein